MGGYFDSASGVRNFSGGGMHRLRWRNHAMEYLRAGAVLPAAEIIAAMGAANLTAE